MSDIIKKIIDELHAIPRIVTLLKLAQEEEVRKDILGAIYSLSKNATYKSRFVQELQKVNIDDINDENKKAFQSILKAISSGANSETSEEEFIRKPQARAPIQTKEASLLLDLDDIPVHQQTNIVESRPKTRADLLKNEDRPSFKRMNSDDFFDALDSSKKKPPTLQISINAPESSTMQRQNLSPTGTRNNRSKSYNPPTGPVTIQQPNIPTTIAGSPPSPLKTLGLANTPPIINTKYDDNSPNRLDLAVSQQQQQQQQQLQAQAQTRSNRSRSVSEKLGDAFSKECKVYSSSTFLRTLELTRLSSAIVATLIAGVVLGCERTRHCPSTLFFQAEGIFAFFNIDVAHVSPEFPPTVAHNPIVLVCRVVMVPTNHRHHMVNPTTSLGDDALPVVLQDRGRINTTRDGSSRKDFGSHVRSAAHLTKLGNCRVRVV